MRGIRKIVHFLDELKKMTSLEVLPQKTTLFHDEGVRPKGVYTYPAMSFTLESFFTRGRSSRDLRLDFIERVSGDTSMRLELDKLIDDHTVNFINYCYFAPNVWEGFLLLYEGAEIKNVVDKYFSEQQEINLNTFLSHLAYLFCDSAYQRTKNVRYLDLDIVRAMSTLV